MTVLHTRPGAPEHRLRCLNVNRSAAIHDILYDDICRVPGAPYIDSDVWASCKARPHSYRSPTIFFRDPTHQFAMEL
ncbi:MAG: hypothetical protein ACRD3K_03425 [Edaphobacter sp.]